MKAMDIAVRAFLSLVLLFLIIITATVLAGAGVKPHIVFFWSFSLFIFGLSAGSVLNLLPKEWATKLFIAAMILVGFTIILQLRVIPVCGDGVCGAGECSRCNKDCSPATCADGICQPKVESCANSNDCACSGLACAPGRNGSDARGCSPVQCGDGFCDATEGSAACCTDCGCASGYSCEANTCYFSIPKVTFSPYRLTTTISAASLAGNPLLSDSSGTPRPLLLLQLRTTKSIQQVNVTYTIPDVITNVVDVGTIYAEQEVEVPWYIKPDPRLLQVRQETRGNATVFINYTDAIGNRYSINRSYPLTLLSANTLDSYGHIVLFTGEIRTTATSAQGIWEELHKQVTIEQRNDNTVQYARETLQRGAGSARDIAVLLASAYNTAGLRTFLVETDQGVFVRVWSGDRFVMLDTRRFNEPFDNAISFIPGYGVYAIDQTIAARNFTRIS